MFRAGKARHTSSQPPRLEEYSRDLSQRYLTVNIPAAQLEAVSDGAVYSSTISLPANPIAIAGRVSQDQRLKFQSVLERAASIVERDIIPRSSRTLNIFRS